MSQIKFDQLKEIDISQNKIKNIQPLKNMSLPFLKFLNLSYNEIQIIEPVTKINSKNLRYIFLQKNQIKDIETFIDSNFPSLKILRVEDNDINLENENDEEIKKKRREALIKINNKYPGRFIYKSIEEQKKEFKDKYNLDISWDNENIDLYDTEGGNEMLKKLFLIITYNPENAIKKLTLRNIDIVDPSLLSRVNFNHLETLDLSVNSIIDLKFLLDMKAKNLKHLFLDYNKINDFNPLFIENFPKLKLLLLNDNNFDSNDLKKNPAYIELKNKKDQNGNQLEIQLDSTKAIDIL
jgi:Leucine-rich repeat (LRR) protein